LPESIKVSAVPRAVSIPFPDRPTTHPPGSVGKLREMMLRAEARVSLWHPDDVGTMDGAAVADILACFIGSTAHHKGDDPAPQNRTPSRRMANPMKCATQIA
jgi:hypothetical protein